MSEIVPESVAPLGAPGGSRVTFLQWLEAAAVRAGLGIFGVLPAGWASTLGGRIMRFVGPFIGASRVADRNLAMALPALTGADRQRIVRDVWENLGRTVGEIVHVGAMKDGVGYQVSGWEHVAGVDLSAGPILILTGHLGNWELIPKAFGDRGVALGLMYRAAGNRLVDDQIVAIRARNFGGRVEMFAKGSVGARGALRHLMRGGHLGMLNDQKLDNGVAAPFFGRDAMTAPALASFALKFKCPVFPVRVLREGPARLHVMIEAPMVLPDSGDRARDVLALTVAGNAILERWVRERPGEWLWLHRRWPKDS